MFKINKAFKNGRLLKSLIGMGRGEFEILLGNFSILLKELRDLIKINMKLLLIMIVFLITIIAIIFRNKRSLIFFFKKPNSNCAIATLPHSV